MAERRLTTDVLSHSGLRDARGPNHVGTKVSQPTFLPVQVRGILQDNPVPLETRFTWPILWAAFGL